MFRSSDDRLWVGTEFYSAQGLQIKAEAWKITCKYCKYVSVRLFPLPNLCIYFKFFPNLFSAEFLTSQNKKAGILNFFFVIPYPIFIHTLWLRALRTSDEIKDHSLKKYKSNF